MKAQDDSALEEFKFSKNRSVAFEPHSDANSIFEDSRNSNPSSNLANTIEDRIVTVERIIEVPVDRVV